MAMKMTEAEWKAFQKNQQKHADVLGKLTSYSKSPPALPPAKTPVQQAGKPSQGHSQVSSQGQAKPQKQRGGLMSIVGKIKGAVKNYQWKHSGATEAKNKKILATKHQYLPRIKAFAAQFGADVDPGDTKAYVYKTVDGHERGATIKYGESDTTIRLKFERAFEQKPTSIKIIRKVKNAANKAKEIREELGKAGEAVKGAVGDGSGSMYNDPNFGGAFVGPPARAPPQKGGKKRRGGGGSSGNSLYPDINWG